MPSPSIASNVPSLRSIGRTLAYTLIYAAAVWFGRATRLEGTPTALVWPAAGVAVLWLLGSWHSSPWRVIDTAALLGATIAGNALTGAPTELAIAFGAANTVQAAVTCFALDRWRGMSIHTAGMLGLIRLVIATLLGAGTGAIVGPYVIDAISNMDWPVDTGVWVLRNGVSAFVLVAARAALTATSTRDVLRTTESVGLLLAGTAVNIAVFAFHTSLPVALAVIPAGVMIGLRASPRTAAFHMLFTWGVITAATLTKSGPLITESIDERVILMQTLLAVVAFLTLALALGHEAEQRLRRHLDDEQAFVSALLEQLSNDLYICDEHGELRRFDQERRALVPALEHATPEDWARLLHAYVPDGSRPLRPDEMPLYRALHGERVTPTEVMVREPGAEPRSYMATAAPILDADGKSRGAVARVVDVTDLREAEAEARRHAADLAVLGRVAHQLAAQTDLAAARNAICSAAQEVSGAAMTMLFEPSVDGERLLCTAAQGFDGAGELTVSLGGEPSGTAIAFHSGKAFFVSDTADHPAVHPAIIEHTGAVSALWQPVIRNGQTVAVLAVGWQQRRAELTDRVGNMLGLLASEAAVAITRGALIGQLDSFAYTDPLTGAFNRRALTDRLVDAQAACRSNAEPLSVLMVDLDHFKRYNDAHGHQQGDHLLKVAVAHWMREVRGTDVIARYGGEEFAFVLPRCNRTAARRLAERLLLATPFDQTCSIGVAEWDLSESADDVLARADRALYVAKKGGRNQVVSADPPAPVTENDVTRLVLSAVREHLGLDLAFLADIADDRLVFRQLDGDAEAFGLAEGDSIPMAGSYCQRMLDGSIDGRVVDAAADPEFADLDVTRDAGIAAYVGAPVQLRDGRVVGTLCALNKTPARQLSTADLRHVRELADAIARHLEDEAGDRPTPELMRAAWHRAVSSVR